MKNFMTLLIAVSALLIVSGCSTPAGNVMPGATPPNLADNAVSAARAARFREITAGFSVRGIGIYPEAFENRYSPAEVTARISGLGFNRVYCTITTEKAHNENFAALLRELGNAGLPVEVVLRQQDFYRRNQTNQLIRNLVWQYPTLKDAALAVLKFNAELPEDVRT